MALSCDCDFGDFDTYYEVEKDEHIACIDSKCYGCCGTIKTFEEVRVMNQYELDEDGDQVNWKPLGKLCPTCSGLYDSLIELGFCISADWGFITEAMDEYRENFK